MESRLRVVSTCDGPLPFSKLEAWRSKEAGEQHSRRGQMLRWLATPLVATVITLSPVSLGQAIAIQNGAALFHKACIGCHDGGGNIIQPGATLFMKDLQRNGIDSEEHIYEITYYGKGRMPGFGEKCTPRGQCTFGARLQDEEIKLLAEFIKSQADSGWPNVKSSAD